MKKNLLLILIILTFVLNYACQMKKFSEGVVEDAKRMDTTKIPEVFNIDSIKNSLDTTKLKK